MNYLKYVALKLVKYWKSFLDAPFHALDFHEPIRMHLGTKRQRPLLSHDASPFLVARPSPVALILFNSVRSTPQHIPSRVISQLWIFNTNSLVFIGFGEVASPSFMRSTLPSWSRSQSLERMKESNSVKRSRSTRSFRNIHLVPLWYSAFSTQARASSSNI